MDDDESEAIYLNEEEELKTQNSYGTKKESEVSSMEAKNQNSFKCYICGKLFTEENTCKEHINICIQEGHKDYKCDLCGKLFFLESSVKKHIHAAHERGKDYKCARNVPGKCDICGKLLSSKRNLYNHIHTIHEGHKDFQCISCEKSFTSANNLRNHVKTAHEDFSTRSKMIKLEVEHDFIESSNHEIHDDPLELQPKPFEFTGNFREMNDPLHIQTIVEQKIILNDNQAIADNLKTKTNENENDPLNIDIVVKEEPIEIASDTNISMNSKPDLAKIEVNENKSPEGEPQSKDPLELPQEEETGKFPKCEEESKLIEHVCQREKNGTMVVQNENIVKTVTKTLVPNENIVKVALTMVQNEKGHVKVSKTAKIHSENKEEEKEHPKPFHVESHLRKYELPHGWIKTCVQRQNSSGHWDVYLHSPSLGPKAPNGLKFRSNPEVTEFLRTNPNIPHDPHLTKICRPPDLIGTGKSRSKQPKIFELEFDEKKERPSRRSNTKIDYNEAVLESKSDPQNQIGESSSDEEYDCEFCEKSFNKEENLMKHILKIHEGHKDLKWGKVKKHTPTIHEEILEPKSDPLNQISDETESNEAHDLKCGLCGKLFSHSSNLKRHHLTIHEGVKDYECESCRKSFAQAGDLRTHIRTIHEGLKDYKCEFCGKAFSQPQHVNIHIHTVHEGHRDYKCESCGESFSRPGSLKRHIHVIHEGHKDYECELCGRTFSQAGILNIHKKTHEGQREIKKYIVNEDRDFKCEFCPKSYSRADHLRAHIRTIHEGQNDFKCDFCHKSYTRADNLRAHIEIVHEGQNDSTSDPLSDDISESSEKTELSQVNIYKGRSKNILAKIDKFKIYNCHYCEKSFNYKKSLKNHTFKVHGVNIGSHICKFCGKSYSGIRRLRNHIRAIHERQKYHKCDSCGKSFTKSGTLKMHIKTLLYFQVYIYYVVGSTVV